MEEKANKVLIKIDEINRKLNYDKIVKFFLAAIAIVIVFSCIDNVAYASGLMGYDGNNSPFEKVTSGWGQFMSDKYRPNYSLDTGDVGTFEIVDKGLNALSNVFFSLVTMISWVGINVFNFCVNNSIVDAFAKVLDKISRALVDGVFNKLFLIMFMFSLVSVCIYFAKKNFAAIVAHFCAFAVIVGLAAVLANSSAKDFVVDTTKFSKDIGVSLITAINGGNEKGDANSEMLGTLWANLVQKPWTIIEFDGSKPVSGKGEDESIKVSKEILSKAPGSDERKDVADKEVKDINFAGRLATTFLLGIISLVKVLILMIVGVIQIFFQISAIAIIMIIPLFLLLAIVPYFGGVSLLKFIGEKYLGVQFGIILTSFVVAMLLLIDNVTLNFFMDIGANFTVALLIQALCWVLIVVFRKRIIDSLARLQERMFTGTGSSIRNAADMLSKGGETTANATRLAAEQSKYARVKGAGKAKILTSRAAGNIIDKAYKKYSDKRFGTSDIDAESLKNPNKKADGNSVKKQGASSKSKDKSVPIDFSDVRVQDPSRFNNTSDVDERLDAARNYQEDGIELQRDPIYDKNQEANDESVNSNAEDRLNEEREHQEAVEGIGINDGSNRNDGQQVNAEAVNNNADDRLNEEREHQEAAEGIGMNDGPNRNDGQQVNAEAVNNNADDRLNEEREHQEAAEGIGMNDGPNRNDGQQVNAESVNSNAEDRLNEEREHQEVAEGIGINDGTSRNDGQQVNVEAVNDNADDRLNEEREHQEVAEGVGINDGPNRNNGQEVVNGVVNNKVEEKLNNERNNQDKGAAVKDGIGVVSNINNNKKVKEPENTEIRARVTDAASNEKVVKTNNDTKCNGKINNSVPGTKSNIENINQAKENKAQEVKNENSESRKKEAAKISRDQGNKNKRKEDNTRKVNRVARPKKSEAQIKSEQRVAKLKNILGVDKKQIKEKEKNLKKDLKAVKSEQVRNKAFRRTLRRHFR